MWSRGVPARLAALEVHGLAGADLVMRCVDCAIPMTPHDSQRCQFCRTFGARRRSPRLERAAARIQANLRDQVDVLEQLRATSADRFVTDPRRLSLPAAWWKRWRTLKRLEKSSERLGRRYLEALESERRTLTFPPALGPLPTVALELPW